MSGTCPKCEKLVSYVTLSTVDVKGPFGGNDWKGVSYLCPHCQTILSVAIDPVALKTDTVNQTVKKLKGI